MYGQPAPETPTIDADELRKTAISANKKFYRNRIAMATTSILSVIVVAIMVIPTLFTAPVYTDVEDGDWVNDPGDDVTWGDTNGVDVDDPLDGPEWTHPGYDYDGDGIDDVDDVDDDNDGYCDEGVTPGISYPGGPVCTGVDYYHYDATAFDDQSAATHLGLSLEDYITVKPDVIDEPVTEDLTQEIFEKMEGNDSLKADVLNLLLAGGASLEGLAGPDHNAEAAKALAAIDEDPDGDGISTRFEFLAGSDPRNADSLPPDTDSDGIPDRYETMNRLDLSKASDAGEDADDDGLSNLDEYLLDLAGTPVDPQNADTDDDTIHDGWEIEHGFDPLSPADKWADPDADGFSNMFEFRYGMDPHQYETMNDVDFSYSIQSAPQSFYEEFPGDLSTYQFEEFYFDTWKIREMWEDFNVKGEGVKIAILDTGVDLDHPDLNVKEAMSFIANETAYDFNGHGTHVAGIIGALDNGIGTTGIAPGADLYVAKVIRRTGYGYDSSIIQGIEWAMDQEVDVILLSVSSEYPSSAMEHAIQAAYERGIITVSPIGNLNGSVGVETYPSSYPNVIAVSGVDADNNVVSYHNYAGHVEVGAYSEYSQVLGIGSTYRDGGYAYLHGSSMASAQIAGLIGLLISANAPKMIHPGDIRGRLQRTSTDIDPLGYDNITGFGIPTSTFFSAPSGEPGDLHTVETFVLDNHFEITLYDIDPMGLMVIDYTWPPHSDSRGASPMHIDVQDTAGNALLDGSGVYIEGIASGSDISGLSVDPSASIPMERKGSILIVYTPPPNGMISYTLGTSESYYPDFSYGSCMWMDHPVGYGLICNDGDSTGIENSNYARLNSEIPLEVLMALISSSIIPQSIGESIDLDGDGLVGDSDPNGLSRDSDNDGLDDDIEIIQQTSPILPDTDGDGFIDSWEVDNDYSPLHANDMLIDDDADNVILLLEYIESSDPHMKDTDMDGLDDYSEIALGTLSNNPDTDNDGVGDLYESLISISPLDPDVDDDEMLDGWELVNGLDVNSNDRAADKDGDMLTNWEEYLIGSSAALKDSDGDMINDSHEVSLGLDPLTSNYYGDNDNDGLSDMIEVLITGTDVSSPDSDGDGLPDGLEMKGLDTYAGIDVSLYKNVGGLYDPNNPDTDGDGLTDGLEDYDGDGISNEHEIMLHNELLAHSTIASPTPYFNLFLPDSDFDGIPDSDEVSLDSNPFHQDTDGDGILDSIEVINLQSPIYPSSSDGLSVLQDDRDGDLVSDSIESTMGLDVDSPDSNGDRISDGLDDPDGDKIPTYLELAFGMDPNVKNSSNDYHMDSTEFFSRSDGYINELLARHRNEVYFSDVESQLHIWAAKYHNRSIGSNVLYVISSLVDAGVIGSGISQSAGSGGYSGLMGNSIPNILSGDTPTNTNDATSTMSTGSLGIIGIMIAIIIMIVVFTLLKEVLTCKFINELVEYRQIADSLDGSTVGTTNPNLLFFSSIGKKLTMLFE